MSMLWTLERVTHKYEKLLDTYDSFKELACITIEEAFRYESE